MSTKAPSRIANRDDIAACYRMILGRDPDDEGLELHLRSHLPIDMVVRSLVGSVEYRQRTESLTALSLFGLDFVVRAQSIYGPDYEAYVFKPLMDLLGPGKTFLDVGANIGMFAVHAAKRGAHVIAVEARPSNSALILENARRNGISVELHPLGVSDHRGYAVLDVADTENAAIRRYEATSVADQIVPLALLDELVGERQIDVMKIDIEGHEYRAMLGAEKMLLRCRPVIVSEYSPDYQQAGSGVSGSTYLQFLAGFGYQVSALQRTGAPVAIDDKLLAEQLNEMCRLAGHHVDLLLEPQ